jgi:hypothetical protein
MYVYDGFTMIKKGLYIILLLLLCTIVSGQDGIRLEHKLKPDKSRTIRMDKPVMVRTFDGNKLKGMASVHPDGGIVLEGKQVAPDNIMMISGFVKRDSRDKAAGLGITIGAGVVLPVALYYILGGIAWAMPNGIFVGSTVLVFDLLLAYVGINLMGIYPRRFSTLNWEIALPPSDSGNGGPILLPFPAD